jgi:amidase
VSLVTRPFHETVFNCFTDEAGTFTGDGHARQGDGEVVEGATETSLDVEFSVDLIKAEKINWPRLENQDDIMVLGSSRDSVTGIR